MSLSGMCHGGQNVMVGLMSCLVKCYVLTNAIVGQMSNWVECLRDGNDVG
jgi:hypothetical protein